MKGFRWMFGAVLLGASLMAVAASNCPDHHSRALCVARATSIAGPLGDAHPSDLAAAKTSATGDGLFYAGTAAGLGTKLFRPASSLETGFMLVGAIAGLAAGDSPVLGRNQTVGWMPADSATSQADAVSKAQVLLVQAMKQSFPGAEIVVYEPDAARAQADAGAVVRFRVKGGICEGHTCVLVPPHTADKPNVVLTGTAVIGKAPDFAGGGDAYVFAGAGAIPVWPLVVDGKIMTHLYMQELTRNLPPWMYAVASPQRKMAGGRLLNEGMTMPLMFNRGETLYFAFPEPVADGPVAFTPDAATTERRPSR